MRALARNADNCSSGCRLFEGNETCHAGIFCRERELNVRKTDNLRGCAFRNGVYNSPSLCRKHRFCAVGGAFRRDLTANHTFFYVDDGVTAVRSEYARREFCLLFVPCKVGRAVFFVRTDDKTHVLRKIYAAIFYRFHRIKHANRRTFVVHCASAVELAAGHKH